MATSAITKSKSWFMHFRYKEGQDTPADARNVLLVVFTLIAAVTFQTGVNPPGGVWQDDTGGRDPGRAIYASQKQAFYVFLISNTIALSTSLLVIVSLTYKFPFHFEIMAATVAMLVTYGSAIFAVTPNSVKFRYVLAAGGLPFMVRGLLYLFHGCRSSMVKVSDNDDHQRLRDDVGSA